jgi:hypothetical protein
MDGLIEGMMMSVPVIEIVKRYLESNCFDGLVMPDTHCGCCIKDGLQPCGEDFSGCMPAYKHMDPRPGHEGDWAMWETKDDPDDDAWDLIDY